MRRQLTRNCSAKGHGDTSLHAAEVRVAPSESLVPGWWDKNLILFYRKNAFVCTHDLSHRLFEFYKKYPSLEDLPNPGIEPRSPTFQADALTSEPPGKPLRISELEDEDEDEGPR